MKTPRTFSRGGFLILSFRRSRRYGFLTVPVTLLALSACGGGGAGGGSTPAVVPTTSPAATATPDPNPTASGNTFAYAGTLIQTFTLYGTPAPAPDPSATPQPTSTPWVSTISQAVTQSVSISSGKSFGGQSGLTDFTAHETDASAQKTTTVTSQTYLSYSPNSSRANGVDVTEIGTSSNDSNGVSLQSVAGSGNGIVEKLPTVAGAQWTNGASRTDTESDPDGQTTLATYAGDGSYQEQITFPEGGNALAILNADGSGLYKLPVTGVTTAPSTITVDAPAGGQIQLAYEIYAHGSLPTAGAFELPVWYPQTPPVLASDTYVDEGPTTLPSSCNAGSKYQSVSVEKIVETENRLDTIFGEYETDQTTQYSSPSYGLLCTVVNDDLKTYYDYSGQGGAYFNLSATPIRDTSVTETLTLQSEQLAAASLARRSSQSIVPHISPRPSLVRARMVLAAAHAEHVRALYARAHSISGMRQPK